MHQFADQIEDEEESEGGGDNQGSTGSGSPLDQGGPRHPKMDNQKS